MSVPMRALVMHTYYDATGTTRIVRAPGDRYELHGGVGMTAAQLAAWFTAVGWAVREPGVDRKPAKAAIRMAR